MIIDFKAHLMNEGSKDYFRFIVMNGLQGIVQFSEEIPKRDIVVELSEENQVINLYYVPLILKAYKDVKKSSKKPYVEAKRNTRRMLSVIARAYSFRLIPCRHKFFRPCKCGPFHPLPLDFSILTSRLLKRK